MTDTDATERVWMTPAVLATLEEELATIADSTESADEARAIELRELIRKAEVGSKPDDGLVEPGMTVTVRFERDGSTEKFLLGSRALVRKDSDVEVYSPTSPLGAAITGRHVGDTVAYQAPSGASIEVSIVEAHPFG